MEKILVVCYSQSGNTHQAACEIQKQTGGDICEIYPWQPYPMEYERLLAQAKKEIRTGYMPHLLPITHNPNDFVPYSYFNGVHSGIFTQIFIGSSFKLHGIAVNKRVILVKFHSLQIDINTAINVTAENSGSATAIGRKRN